MIKKFIQLVILTLIILTFQHFDYKRGYEAGLEDGKELGYRASNPDKVCKEYEFGNSEKAEFCCHYSKEIKYLNEMTLKYEDRDIIL